MTRSETTTADVLPSSAPNESEKQSYGKPPGLVASLETRIKGFAVSTRVLVPSETSENGRAPALDGADPTENTICVPPSPLGEDGGSRVAPEHKGTKHASGSVNTETDVKNERERALPPSGGVRAAPQWAIGTPAETPTPPSSLAATEGESGLSSGTGLCTSSGSGSTLSLSGGEQPGNKDMPTAPRVAPANSLDDPFREPVQIPGCSPPTFVYPHSSTVISAAFHERYREVVNIFRHNIKEHPRLRESLEYIDYTLKLCGTHSGDPHPSILIFCRHGEFKDLHGLLTKKELKYQYCLRRSGRRFPWSGNQASVTQEGHRPFFNLYFWRQRRPRTLYWGQELVRIHPPLSAPPPQRPTDPSRIVPDPTLCGSVVELHGLESSFSTLGCVIQIDSEFYAVTTMHAFGLSELTDKRLSREMSGCETLDRPGADAAASNVGRAPVCVQKFLGASESDLSDAVPEDGDYLVDDIEYESLPDDDDDDEEGELNFSDNHSTVTGHSHDNDEAQGGDQTNEVKEMLALFPTPRELDESGELDLDWALIKLEDQQDWRPNAFVHPGVSSRPVFLSEVAPQPAEERQVFIITGKATPQKGMLQPGNAILGGINGKTLSTMWTVVLSEPNRLEKGDSGSVVVDAETKAIYGHVVGSNPIGEVYVSPYMEVLEQIRRRFPGSRLRIPDPPSTLARLIKFYTVSVGEESGLKLLERLRKAHGQAVARHDEVQQLDLARGKVPLNSPGDMDLAGVSGGAGGLQPLPFLADIGLIALQAEFLTAVPDLFQTHGPFKPLIFSKPTVFSEPSRTPAEQNHAAYAEEAWRRIVESDPVAREIEGLSAASRSSVSSSSTSRSSQSSSFPPLFSYRTHS